jgi:F-type H+-transporting ATPase subunit b
LELSWSTFLLEIINFLVLVWILKRFLYKPVLDVITRRRDGIEKRLAEARRLHDEAETLKADYENRLADWERERQKKRDELKQELDQERRQRLEELQKTLAQEREKAEVLESRRRAEDARVIERRALQLGGRFAGRLLAEAAGPELEARLLELVLEGLQALPQERVSALRAQWGEPPEAIVVTSAYPLPEKGRQSLQQALAKITGLDVPVRCEQDEDLLAGVRITVGAWVLAANLRDELEGFMEFAHVER